MEKGLDQINAVPGVGGSFLCDNRGDVIVSSDPAVLATVTMNTIGREVGRAFVALETAGQKASRIEFAYDTWRLLALDIGDAVLFVVCQPDASMAMVRMSAVVAIGIWQTDSAARKRLERHRAERRALVNSTQLDQGSWSSWAVIASR